jgi:sugar phosphate permease
VENISIYKSPKKFFYGYWILAGTFLLHALGSGEYFYGFSVFYNPLKEEYGWSSAVTSGAVSLSRLEGGIEGPLVGFLIDKYGPRKLLSVGLFLTDLGFISMTLVDSVLMLYLVYGGLLSIGYNTGFSHSLSTMITFWFYKQRSRALSVYAIAAGVGGALIVPLLARAINQYGWRTTSIICGLSFWIIGFPLLLVFRDKPEDLGLLPDGIDLSLTKYIEKETQETKEIKYQITTKEAITSPTFSKLFLGEAFRSFLLSSIVLHQIPHLISIGIKETQAASILGLLIFVSIPGRLVFGALGDFLSKRLLLSFTMLFQALGVLILAYAKSVLHIYIFVIIYGLAYGGAIPLLMAIRGDLFGRESFAKISGLMAPFKTLGGVGGPIFAGYIFDLTGSYRIAFQIFAILAIFSSLAFYSLEEVKTNSTILSKK